MSISKLLATVPAAGSTVSASTAAGLLHVLEFTIQKSDV